MTTLQKIKLDEVVVQPVEHFSKLSIEDHIKEANRVYQAIRPALTSIGWVVKLFNKKAANAIQVLVTVLDGLFGVITPL